MNSKADFSLFTHFNFAIILIILLLGIMGILYTPEWTGPDVLVNTYNVFGLSFLAFLLLISIGTFLLHRWWITGKSNNITFVWGVSFLIYSITFVGLILDSFGLRLANTHIPGIFFIYRQSMILFIAGIYYGLSMILTKSNFLRKGVTILITGISYILFIYGLLIKKDIELTMYLFLSFIFVPLCFLVASFYLQYGLKQKQNAIILLSFGFGLLGLTYLSWAPWHKNYFYFVMFYLFILSLIVILIGYIYLSLTKEIKQSEKNDKHQRLKKINGNRNIKIKIKNVKKK